MSTEGVRVSETEHVAATVTVVLINKANICLGGTWGFVSYSPSSDSLSESWLMMSFLCSSACSRAAWSFRGNSEASSSIYKQPKTLPSPAININVWRISFKGSNLQQRTACSSALFKARPCHVWKKKQHTLLLTDENKMHTHSVHSGVLLLQPYMVWYD